MRAELTAMAELCVGYGAYHACCYNGIVRRAFLGNIGLAAIDVWACLILLIGASGVGCLVVRALHKRGVHLAGPLGAGIDYASIALCAVLDFAMRPSAGVSYLLAAAVGLATSVPLLLWFKAFLALYHRRGPGACMLAISCGTMLGYIPALFPVDVAAPSAQLAILLAGTILAAAFQFLFLKQLGWANEAVPACKAQGRAKSQGPYRLSVYVVSLVASFDALGWVPAMTAALACMFLIGLSLLANKGATLHFGLLIRISLVIAGTVFAFAPALYMRSPVGLAALCQAVVVVEGVAMTLLSVEICHERNLAMSDVMPANYAIYVVCVCCGMGLGALADGNSGELAWQLIAALAVTSVVAVIPALPSSSSTAAAFTDKVLRENERYEERSSRVCAQIAAQYGLTPRETDVLELLLLGRTRAQIADALALSSWTVKEYISAIYGKVGVHSAKDLMVRCMAQAGSPQE